jgi:thymidylate kinase
MAGSIFIALECAQESVRRVQFKLLAERLRAAGHEVAVYTFPRGSEKSSYFAQRYLEGEYGPEPEISPYTASLFFALDRYEASPKIRQDLAREKIVLVSCYSGSTMARQGAKFTNAAEQRGFFMWNDSLEFQLLGIPRPTVNIVLKTLEDGLKDEVTAFDSLCRLFPKDFKAVDCAPNKKTLKIPEINNRIWEIIKPLLPKPKRAGRGRVVKLDTPQNQKEIKEESDQGSIVFKDVSVLAANKLLELNNANLEYKSTWPSTKNRLAFYIPPGLSANLSKKYKSSMDKLAVEYTRMALKAKSSEQKKMLNAVIPLAALGEAKLNQTTKINRQLAALAKRSNLPEIQGLARSENTKNSEDKEPEPISQLIKRLADTKLPPSPINDADAVKIIEVAPLNEFDLLPGYLYSRSSLAPEELAAQLDRLKYHQKEDAFKTAIVQDASSLLERVNYRAEIISDREAMSSLIKSLSPDVLQSQDPTPRYGYGVPEELESIGIEEQFIEAFDLSLELYSLIQAEGHDNLAGYATLSGHKLRWNINFNAAAFLKTPVSLNNEARKILKALLASVAEFHPLIRDSIGGVKPAKTVQKPTPPRKTTQRR